MTFEFTPAAKAEFIASVDYYELQQPGLGLEFAEEIYAAIDGILQYPDGWTRLDSVFHRCLTRRFPYGAIYYVDNDTVIITAVMNLHREPNYWENK